MSSLQKENLLDVILTVIDIERLRKIILEDIEKTDLEIKKININYNDSIEEIKILQYTNAKD